MNNKLDEAVKEYANINLDPMDKQTFYVKVTL